MFGYVRIQKEELKMGEYEQYRGVYCSLCRQYGRRYGWLARMMLSYDMTLVALLRMALQPQPVTFQRGHCPYNPFVHHLSCADEESLAVTADFSLLLAMGRLRDTAADERGWRRWGARCLLRLLARAEKKAAACQPAIKEAVDACLADQAACEARGALVDEAADPTARLTAAVLMALAQSVRDRRVLERLGYCLGRWIYLIDAADDLEKDAAAGRFNPYLCGRTEQLELPALREQAERSLCACAAECRTAYELLDIHRFDGILRNILERGMPAQQFLATHPDRKASETYERSV